MPGGAVHRRCAQLTRRAQKLSPGTPLGGTLPFAQLALNVSEADHSKHLRPNRYCSQKQRQRRQSHCLFNHRPNHNNLP
jgi:hypothetical protein